MEPTRFQEIINRYLVKGKKQTADRKTDIDHIMEPKLVPRSQMRICDLCGNLVKDPCHFIMTNQIGPGKKPKISKWVRRCQVCKQKFDYITLHNK